MVSGRVVGAFSCFLCMFVCLGVRRGLGRVLIKYSGNVRLQSIFYLDVRKGKQIFTENHKKVYRCDVVDEIPCMRADIRID